MSAEPIPLTPHLAPVAPIARVLSQFDRAKIEAFAEVAIALLDLQDGDADAEVTDAEDDFATFTGDGPGCPLADPGEADEDCGEEERGEQAGWHNGVDQSALLLGCLASHHDDAEEDDPSGICDEDGVNTALESLRRHAGPGCSIGDGDEVLP
jgi:hypothetical protein